MTKQFSRDSAENIQALKPDSPRAVLHIEDNPMNRRLMRQIFVLREDLVLNEADTAEAGIEMARSAPPSLILMDLDLPGMDGYTALSTLRADARTAHIPVIAVSGNAMKGDEERGLNAGFAAYLSKPLDIRRLFTRIDALLAPRAD